MKKGDTVRVLPSAEDYCVPERYIGQQATIVEDYGAFFEVVFEDGKHRNARPIDLELLKWNSTAQEWRTIEPQVIDTPPPNPSTPDRQFFSIIVAPYAIADFIRALYRNGDHEIAVTKEDNDLTVRIPLDKYYPPMECGKQATNTLVSRAEEGEK